MADKTVEIMGQMTAEEIAAKYSDLEDPVLLSDNDIDRIAADMLKAEPSGGDRIIINDLDAFFEKLYGPSPPITKGKTYLLCTIKDEDGAEQIWISGSELDEEPKP